MREPLYLFLQLPILNLIPSNHSSACPTENPIFYEIIVCSYSLTLRMFVILSHIIRRNLFESFAVKSEELRR
jgi:hypothetical protein